MGKVSQQNAKKMMQRNIWRQESTLVWTAGISLKLHDRKMHANNKLTVILFFSPSSSHWKFISMEIAEKVNTVPKKGEMEVPGLASFYYFCLIKWIKGWSCRAPQQGSGFSISAAKSWHLQSAEVQGTAPISVNWHITMTALEKIAYYNWSIGYKSQGRCLSESPPFISKHWGSDDWSCHLLISTRQLCVKCMLSFFCSSHFSSFESLP